MTLGEFLSHMGIGSKQLSERLSHGDYGHYGGGGGVHESHLVYSYDPPEISHEHVASSKHHHGGGGHKSNAAMSALTLLSFLFFLHILQQCLKEHMMAMTTPPVMIMTAGREGEEPIPKAATKIDKTGTSEGEEKQGKRDMEDEADYLTKIKTAEHIPKGKYRHVFHNLGNQSLDYRGFVNAMDDSLK